jgi:hypothetical protein
MWTNVNGYSCQIYELGRGCKTDGFPQYVLNATSSAQIATALAWANQRNVRVNVKSTGHDFLGRSTQPYSLSIWVHFLQRREYHEDSFKPVGCGITIDGPAVSTGGGTQMGILLKHVGRFGMTVVSGSSNSVSVGGYISGGGHSILSGKYGLAADSVLELEMVTPDGKILIANECQNTDLFWAVRGGGGGTFGVMSRVTLKAFPQPPVATWNGNITGPPGADSTWDAVTAFHTAWAKYISPHGCTGYTIGNVWGQGNAKISVMCPEKASKAETEKIMVPVLQETNEAGKGFAKMTGKSGFRPVPKISKKAIGPTELIDVDGPNLQTYGGRGFPGNGENKIIASWLYGHAELTHPDLKQALMDSSDNDSLLYQDFTGGPACHNPPFIRGGGSAVGPGWRKALVRPSAELQWPGDDEAKLVRRKQAAVGFTKALKKLNPEMGTYVNEADPDMDDIQAAFWGSNYPKLLEIKKKIDPSGSFWCKQCVGGEEWEQSKEGELCKI